MRQTGLVTASARLIAWSVAALAVAGLLVPVSADAAGRRPPPWRHVTVAPGVARWSVPWRSHSGHQWAHFVSVDLTRPGVRLDVRGGRQALNQLETTAATAARSGAVAAVNGDFFDLRTGIPFGGVVSGGRLLKTPQSNRDEHLYVTSLGTVGIGRVVWNGTVTAQVPLPPPDTGTVDEVVGLPAVNTPEAAAAGQLTLFTPELGGGALPHCVGASGPLRGSTLVVTDLRYVGRFRQMRNPATRMLAACGAAGQWLLANAGRGSRLALSGRLTTPDGVPITALVSGGRILMRAGQRYDDLYGNPTPRPAPATAVCVTQDQRHLLLIAIDGRLKQAVGVTANELQDFVARYRCYDAISLDGGGSTTMVTRPAGARTVQVLNRPSDRTGLRPVANSLLVFYRR